MEQKEAVHTGERSPAEKEWADAYEHLQKGYDNGQQVIRAMDTKTSILTGLSVFALGAIAGLIKIFADYFTKYPEDVCSLFAPGFAAALTMLLQALAVIGAVILGVMCIFACMGTLIARPRKKLEKSPQTTVLFPSVDPDTKESERNKDLEYYERILSGQVNCDMIRDEYYDQIVNVGNIVHQKIAHNKKAVRLFKWQVGLTGAALILAIPAMLAVCYARSKGLPQTAAPSPTPPAIAQLPAAPTKIPTIQRPSGGHAAAPTGTGSSIQNVDSTAPTMSRSSPSNPVVALPTPNASAP
jgi:hypothetical protein